MKKTLAIILLFLVARCVAAGVYVVPIMQSSWGFVYINMMVNQQGPFSTELDTGSVNFMVPGDSSVCPTCKAPIGIAPSGHLGKKFTVRYDGGRYLNARAYRTQVQAVDSANNPKIPAAFQTLGLITKTNGSSLPIMGMAQPNARLPDGLTTYIQSLRNSGLISSLNFMLVGCPHSKKGTELVLGGIDPRLSRMKPLTIAIRRNENHYDVTPISLSIVGSHHAIGYFYSKNSTQNSIVSVDSGTAEIGFPNRLYVPLIKALKARTHLPNSFWERFGTSLTQKQIASLPALEIKFPHHITLIVPSSAYVIPDPSDNAQSLLMIQNGGEKEYSVLGAAFLSAFAVEFNRSRETLSFYSNKKLCMTPG